MAEIPKPPSPPKPKIICEGRYIIRNGTRWPAKDSLIDKLWNLLISVKND